MNGDSQTFHLLSFFSKHLNLKETMNTKAHLQSPTHWFISEHLLDKPLVEQAHITANRQHTPLVKYLIDQNMLNRTEIAAAASRHFLLPMMDLGAMNIVTMPITTVDSKLIQKHRVLPLYKARIIINTWTIGSSQ
jgi:hypothetical protein